MEGNISANTLIAEFAPEVKTKVVKSSYLLLFDAV